MIDSITAERQWLELASGTVSESVLPASPFQLVTLWDMLRFEARWFYHASINLDRQICDLHREIKARGSNDNLTESETTGTITAVEMFVVYSERLSLIRTKDAIEDILLEVKYFTFNRGKLGQVRDMLIRLRTALARDLNESVFLFLSLPDTKYYQQEQLFGSEVFESFPSARYDVGEAGNCYVLGRHTACVFHCMRILEKGLHALVADLNANHGANIVFNKQIESVNWGNIIEKTEAEIKRLIAPNAQPRMQHDDLQFFSQTATEFVYFKSAWRDDVSHSRSNYDDTEALTVLNHVEAFMRKISRKLTE